MNKKLDDILYKVEKPGRYIGNEINSYKKDINEVAVRFGFAFPDVYEVGMSHLGLHILYNMLNAEEDIYCERIFSPWADMEAIMREEKVDIFTLETYSPIKDLDMVGFTLQYELSYSNILNILDLGGIPLLTEDRDESHPIILAGGPCVYNAEPIADLMDIMIIGEGEEVTLELIELYKNTIKVGKTRQEFFEEAAKIQGVYVPSLYEVSYKEDGTIESFTSKVEGLSNKIEKRIIKDLDDVYYPDRFLVPNVEIVHDRAMVEIFRGCTRGCRFCQAGMIYRPLREKSVETITSVVEQITKNTGYEELSLASLSTLDYSRIEDLVMSLIEKNEADRIGLSLPSLRVDAFSVEILKEIQKVRKTGLTFAPEAGTQRMRDVINKGVTEEAFRSTMEQIFALGWSRVKLYFMIGLPTETYEDLDGIEDVSNLATYLYKKTPMELRGKAVAVTTSASCFVPKPFTPFQWMPQDTLETFKEKQMYLKDRIKNKKIKFIYHDPKTSYLEGVFARGDRRLSKVVVRAFELGAKFDGWGEFFDLDIWEQAFKETGIDPHFYANRERSYDEILPWDFIDIGVTKEFLIEENEKAVNGVLTKDCRSTCTGCGVNQGFLGGVC